MKYPVKKWLPLAVVAAVVIMGGYLAWKAGRSKGLGEGFVGGNGRIEATEIDISAKLAGRIEEIFAQEGEFVEKGQLLAIMQTDTLEAQLNEAKAQLMQRRSDEVKARAQVALRESDKLAAEAVVAQRLAELDAKERRLARSSVLSKTGAMAIQSFDDDETAVHGARAAVKSAQAQVTVAEAAIEAARAEADGAKSNIVAAEATVARIEADINDSRLTAPRGGRIQYRIAQPGEVLAAGGKVLNLVDLTDVYMTFFLPETVAGRVALGSEARIVLDAAPEYPIPASISYVASTAQFTPKTVETESERQKLMFRVKAQIDPKLLEQYITQVKTGLPGVAWVRIDPKAQWPDSMAVRRPGASLNRGDGAGAAGGDGSSSDGANNGTNNGTNNGAGGGPDTGGGEKTGEAGVQ